MTDKLLSAVMRDWSDEAAVPHDLADRALGRRTTVRRRAVPVLAGLATAAVVVGAVAALAVGLGTGDGAGVVPAADGRLSVSADTTNNPPQDIVAAGGLAVAAVVTSSRVPMDGGWQTLRRHYAVLDPATETYRPTDWSYLSVAPGLETAAVLEGDLPASRIGILDLASGDVRWVPTDHPVASLAWSPDGSRVLATAYDGDPDLQKPTGDHAFRMGDAARTGFVVVDATTGSATFTTMTRGEHFGGREDLGWTADGQGVRSPAGQAGEQFFDLDGSPTTGSADDYNTNGYIDAATLSLTSPDGRFTITRDSGLPTAITDNDTGQVYRQEALQVLGWADHEHVVTLAGCSAPCEGTNEFKNGLVLMRYDGSDRVPLTGTRKGADGDWYFQLTPR
jgi:hypothetical protein